MLTNYMKASTKLHKQLVLKSKWMYNIYYFFYFFGVGSFLPLYVIYLRRELGFSEGQTGLIQSILPLVLIISQPIWGIINDRYNASTKIIVSALIMLGITEVFVFTNDQFYLMVIFTIVFGVFNFAISPIQDGLSVLFSKRYNYKFGSIRIFGSIGWATATFVSGIAVDKYGYSSIMYLSGVSYLIAILLFLKVKKVRRKKRKEKTISKYGHIADIFKNKVFITFLIFASISVGVLNAVPFFYGMKLEDLDATEQFIGFMNTLMVSTEIVTMFILILLKDKFKDFTLLLFAIITQIPTIIILMFVDQPEELNILIIIAILRGFYQGLFIPLIINYIASIVKEEEVSTGIMLNSAIALGFMNWLTTLVGGYLVEWYSYSLVFIIILGFVFTSLIFAIHLNRKKKKQMKANLN
ncbi:Major facilitator superfamily protein [Haloplasma contractile SSD-17B]|uniref:Major facilitator superfamily protein n=2 Tax=Haloplasma TaxID=471824 RepID=U2EEB8_9MOLU|nr:Major facilitator superfamily protein [Haloplasma contractile SSD-17B]